MRKVPLMMLSALAALTFISCEKDPAYSCDPEIDSWAKTNLAQIREMPLAEFKKMMPPYQKAAFRVFDSKRKKEIWTAKITQTMTLDWTAEEKKHLLELQAIAEEYLGIIYDDEYPERKDEFCVAIYKWQKKAMNTFGWNKQVLYAITNSPNNLLSTEGELETDDTQTSLTVSSCQCLVDFDGFISDCDSEDLCVPGTCSTTKMGCGTFWTESCNGICGKYGYNGTGPKFNYDKRYKNPN